jgi:hypothetical protein
LRISDLWRSQLLASLVLAVSDLEPSGPNLDSVRCGRPFRVSTPARETPVMQHATIDEIDGIVRGTTAPQRFLEVVDKHPTLSALHSMRGDKPDSWNVWTLRDVADNAAAAVPGCSPTA